MRMLRFNDFSIKKKLLLIILSINLFVLLLAFSGFMIYDVMIFRDQAQKDLSALTELIGRNCAAALLFSDSEDAKDVLASLTSNSAIAAARVVTTSEIPLAEYARDGSEIDIMPPPYGDGCFFDDDGLVCSHPVILRGIPMGRVVVKSDLSGMYALLKKHGSIVFVVLLISILCVLVLSEKLQRLVSAPIVRLAELARTVSKEKDFSVRGIKEGRDEAGQLVDAFNDMLEQIEQQNAFLIQARRTAELSAQESKRLAEETRLTNLKLEKEIAVRRKAQEELKSYQEGLEEMVKARTRQLTEANSQLSTEILERKIAEEKVNIQLKEKSTLLGEIHHRVRNNLQVISSLMELTRRRTLNAEARRVLAEARSRIFTMALIHSHLYESEDFNKVNMRRHIHKLWANIQQMYALLNKNVAPVINCKDVYLTVPQAIPCALVLNEAISNVFKHAYQEGAVGPCYITICRSDQNRVFMRVKDEGVGIPECVDVETAETLGIKMMRNLVRLQLKGDFFVEQGQGTDIRFEFDLLHDDPLIH